MADYLRACKVFMVNNWGHLGNSSLAVLHHSVVHTLPLIYDSFLRQPNIKVDQNGVNLDGFRQQMLEAERVLLALVIESKYNRTPPKENSKQLEEERATHSKRVQDGKASLDKMQIFLESLSFDVDVALADKTALEDQIKSLQGSLEYERSQVAHFKVNSVIPMRIALTSSFRFPKWKMIEATNEMSQRRNAEH